MNQELVQLINIILYRLMKSVRDAGDEYFDFKAGNEARSPAEILSHLVDVSSYGLSLVGTEKLNDIEGSVLEKVKGNFLALKSHLSQKKVDTESSKKLINGPLSDVLTHIGQLALLRRLAQNPIEWENYTNANT